MGVKYLEDNANQRFTLLSAAITAALGGKISTPILGLRRMKYVALESQFDFGSSGTTTNFWVQTSLDGGTKWIDIANFTYSAASGRKGTSLDTTTRASAITPDSGVLANNALLNGVLGDRLRVAYDSVGDHGGASIVIVGVSKA